MVLSRWVRTILILLCMLPLADARPSSVYAVNVADCDEETYVIVSGDSLALIADECGIPFAALLGINWEIANPDRIRPGQVIRLVAGVALEKPPAAGAAQTGGLQENGDYITRPGDSLARIAYLYRTNIPDILRANPNLSLKRVIYAGQVIHLPPDAKWEKGWVGVNTLRAESDQDIIVHVVDFPAYSEIDLNVGQLDIDGTIYIYDTFDGKTDAIGEARVKVTLPFYAWSDEEWVIEVVTTELPKQVRSVSPIITIY